MIPGLVALQRVLLACGLIGALVTSWLVYDAVAPARAALRCSDITPDLEPGRYRVVETCETRYTVTYLGERGAFMRYSLRSTPELGERPHELRFYTAYPSARRAHHSAPRSWRQALRYAARHGEDLWPLGRSLDVRLVPSHAERDVDVPTLYFRDPPLALRVETVMSILLTLCSLLGLLLVRYLRLRWAPRPRQF